MKRILTIEEYVDGITSGNRVILSKAITLIESTRTEHAQLAEAVLDRLLPRTGRSIRLGITGVPGVGKSTFIEKFGGLVADKGKRVAVLAVDPSSSRAGGSILGDKTRMFELGRREDVFIRPSPAGKTLGGVARKTRETMLLCEAAGYDVIIVETVGVGQSETAVHSMVDFFLLLMLAGAGDELQGIKRGIMEMADVIAINKADGDNKEKASRAKSEYAAAIHLFPPSGSGWTPQVLTCSGIQGDGLDDIWQSVQSYVNTTTIGGFFEHKRREQNRYWLEEALKETLWMDFLSRPSVKEEWAKLERQVVDGRLSPFAAARRLLTQSHEQPPVT